MVYRGHVRNGMIVLDEEVDLSEGAEVRVETIASEPEAQDASQAGKIPSLYERLKPFIGKAEGLPHDMSKNLDHYLYGTPKRP